MEWGSDQVRKILRESQEGAKRHPWRRMLHPGGGYRGWAYKCHLWSTFVNEGPGKPAVCLGWCIYYPLFSPCALPTMTSLASIYWPSPKHREAMTFALFPSPFSSEVWDYGMRQVEKERGVVRLEFSSFASWDISRFFFPLATWPSASGQQEPWSTEKSTWRCRALGYYFHLSLSPVSHTANLENSG